MVAIGYYLVICAQNIMKNATAADPRIDALRAKMQVRENPQFSSDYHDPEKRSIANSLQLFFTDGTTPSKSPSNTPSAIAAAEQKASPSY